MLDIRTDWLNMQLSGASGVHSEAMAEVQSYRSYYDGAVDLEVYKGHSKVVMRDVMRTVEGSIPSLVDPFLGKDIAVVESQDAASEEAAKEHARLINYQWNKKANPLETAENIARNLMIDGTVWTYIRWDANGYPTMEVVPFEAVIPDPSATKVDDLKFVIYRRKVTVSDILDQPGWFGKHTLDSLQPLMASTDTQYEPANDMGRDDSYDAGQRALDEIEVFEYYGEYDIKGNGSTTPIVAIWSQNMLLTAFDSPYPDFSIPFDNTVYTRRPFSIYGVGVGGVIGDKQTQRSGLMRGIFDNMNRSNNAVKFIKKGALDPINHMRLMNKEPVVEINTKDSLQNSIWDGNFNSLPQDVYKMLADIEMDEENLTGITKYAVGSDSRSLNQTATGVSIISSMSQRRLVFITQHISGLLSRVFKKWMKLNQALLDNPYLQGDFDLYVKAGTAGLVEKKNNDIISMMQAISNMPAGIDPMIMNSLVAELASNMSLDGTAKLIEQSMEQQQQMKQMQMQQGPNPEEQMVKQMMMEKEMASINKDKSIAMKNQAQAQETMVDASIKSVGG